MKSMSNYNYNNNFNSLINKYLEHEYTKLNNISNNEKLEKINELDLYKFLHNLYANNLLTKQQKKVFYQTEKDSFDSYFERSLLYFCKDKEQYFEIDLE